MDIDPKKTALVLIDLQNGIIGLDLGPRSGETVKAGCVALAEKFRAAGAPVILVNVTWSKDYGDLPSQPVDAPGEHPEGGIPDAWAALADGVAAPTDIRITKRQWGAFYGTELDLQLRRRGITTIVLAGIATNLGVESTARSAWEHGYAVVLVEDLCTSFNEAMHDFSFNAIFPMLGRVVKAADVTV
jgi:nicotinamidase-related amidase